VAIVDQRAPPPRTPFTWHRADAVGDPKGLRALAQGADAILVALPGEVADGPVMTLAKAGARVADMSFVPDPLPRAMAAAARRSGAVVVRDVGVAPGLSHILAAACDRQLGGMDELQIFVGGLPRTPPPSPFRHAVYFNPLDLISEYTRPARCRRGRLAAATDPLAEGETLRLRDATLGPLEAFPSDGLRSLLSSFPRCHDMVEMTLRWPGHLAEMRRLAREGLLRPVAPAQLTALALQEAFPGDRWPDVLLMEVHARKGRRRVGWRLLDRASGGQSAMARTTAFTAAAVARTLAAGHFAVTGAHGPEALGRFAKAERSVLGDLARAGVRMSRRPRLSQAP
jgi:saccharopine dehydrogenase-like NADP-dependent oxidoreductase